MADKRCKDFNWVVRTDADAQAGVATWEGIHTTLLMDIRDELKRLNSVLYCPNFQAIPRRLERIARNTVKPKRKARRTA